MGRGEEIGPCVQFAKVERDRRVGMKPLHVCFNTPCRFIPFYPGYCNQQ